MALDIRLDFIKNIRNHYIDRMTAIRSKFVEMDDLLKFMADETKDAATNRTIALARTYNEQACQSSIKALCLLGEVKEEPHTP